MNTIDSASTQDLVSSVVRERNRRVEIRTGDCVEVMREMPDQSVHCCVTSPPYFGLREYGMDGQIGREDTPDEFVARLVEVFREVRRVLRDDGTLWLNLGDSYAANRKYQVPSTKGGPKHGPGQAAGGRGSTVPEGLKPKDLIGIPWRVAFALQADGWYLRQEIIWHKPNPMPESVRDRCTRSHEQIFMLSKSGSATIWRASDTGEWSASPDKTDRIAAPTDEDADATKPRWRGYDYFYDGDAIKTEPKESSVSRIRQSTFESQTGGEKDYRNGTNANRSMRKTLENWAKNDKQRGHGRRHAGFNDRWDAMSKSEQTALGANKRSVWTVSTKPFKGAHFATFPPDLIEPCVLAGCPPGGTVLDPFFGAGTTGLVAQRNERDCVGIELNPAYVDIARERLGLSDMPKDVDIFA